jgi:hypothetical protein
MFRINDNKGFQIKLDNGYTVSVQFGPGNYGSNYNLDFIANMNKPMTALTAETALLDPDGNFVAYEGEDVQGHRTSGDVLALLNYAASLKGTTDDK